MKITLANGTELEALGVRGENIYYQGANRDCLCFILDPELYSLAEIDGLFTAANCASVTLTDDSGGSYVHEGYTIRRSLEKSTGDSRTGYGGTETPKEKLIVKMAQISYLERTQAQLADAVEALILSGLEG